MKRWSRRIETNIVRVSAKREDAERMSVRLSDPHWIGDVPAFPFSTQAQARYREKPFAATVSAENDELEQGLPSLKVEFDESRIAAAGQSLVFYDGERCLGGAIINS